MTALALREDQDFWDDRQLAVLYQMGIGEEVTKPELAAFLHEAQQRRLDPFTRQIYLIGRNDREAGRKVYRSQTGIDGFRLIARRAADKARETIEYEDTLWFDADGGKHEVWLADEPPFACRVTVLRGGKRFPAIARYSSYVQLNYNGNPTGLWKKMPDGQLEKCCEAKALRKAFPEELGGIYTDDEMAQADNPQVIQATAEVVSDEPAQDAPAGDPWYVRPSPEQEWLAAALEAAPKHATLDACGVAWSKVVEYVKAGKLTEAEAARLQDALRARITELKAAPAEPPCEGEVVEGEVADLDPEDEWAEKVADISDLMEAEAALSDLNDMLSSGAVDEARYKAIAGAIDTRLAQIEQRAAA